MGCRKTSSITAAEIIANLPIVKKKKVFEFSIMKAAFCQILLEKHRFFFPQEVTISNYALFEFLKILLILSIFITQFLPEWLNHT